MGKKPAGSFFVSILDSRTRWPAAAAAARSTDWSCATGGRLEVSLLVRAEQLLARRRRRIRIRIRIRIRRPAAVRLQEMGARKINHRSWSASRADPRFSKSSREFPGDERSSQRTMGRRKPMMISSHKLCQLRLLLRLSRAGCCCSCLMLHQFGPKIFSCPKRKSPLFIHSLANSIWKSLKIVVASQHKHSLAHEQKGPAKQDVGSRLAHSRKLKPTEIDRESEKLDRSRSATLGLIRTNNR